MIDSRKMENLVWPRAIFSVMSFLCCVGGEQNGVNGAAEKTLPSLLGWFLLQLSGRIFSLTHFLLAFDKWEYLYHFPRMTSSPWGNEKKQSPC